MPIPVSFTLKCIVRIGQSAAAAANAALLPLLLPAVQCTVGPPAPGVTPPVTLGDKKPPEP
jgi:hypothetical protein